MALTLLLVVALRLLLGESADYDERQTADQGMAAKYALWTFLGYSFLWIYYGISGYEKLLETEMILLIGCVVVLLVYLTIVIARDAYEPMNFSGFPWLLLIFGAVGVGVFVWTGEMDLRSWSDRAIAGWSGLACGVVLIWSGLLVLGKRVLARFEKE